MGKYPNITEPGSYYIYLCCYYGNYCIVCLICRRYIDNKLSLRARGMVKERKGGEPAYCL